MQLSGIDVGIAHDNDNNENLIRVRVGEAWITCSPDYARFVAKQLVDAADFINPKEEEDDDPYTN